MAGQEKQQGTFIEESGDSQDSTKMADILDYNLELGEEKSSNTRLMYTKIK